MINEEGFLCHGLSDHQQLGWAETKQSRSPAHCSLVTEAGSVINILGCNSWMASTEKQ